MAEAEFPSEVHEHEEHAAEHVEGHAGAVHHHPPTGFIRKYIFSIDHKVIGIQYLLLALFSVFLGMLMSVLMRLKMTWPEHSFWLLGVLFPQRAPGGVTTQEFYLSRVAMHGTTGVFFVLTPAPQDGCGHYLLPIHARAGDLGFPVPNLH